MIDGRVPRWEMGILEKNGRWEGTKVGDGNTGEKWNMGKEGKKGG